MAPHHYENQAICDLAETTAPSSQYEATTSNSLSRPTRVRVELSRFNRVGLKWCIIPRVVRNWSKNRCYWFNRTCSTALKIAARNREALNPI